MKPLLLVLLAISGHASAQQVHKCVKGKEVIYQSSPCAADQHAAKQWSAVPEPPPTNAQLWQKHYARQQAERESAYLRSLARGRHQPSSSGAAIPATAGNACADAKRRRDAIEKQIGLNRNIDSMRSLSSMVYEACKK